QSCAISPVEHATATLCVYTLSLHDALPISRLDVRRVDAVEEVPEHLGLSDERGHTALLELVAPCVADHVVDGLFRETEVLWHLLDRKSTRLNSSHGSISYAVFCLKKKTNTI